MVCNGGGTKEQADRVPLELLKTYPEPVYIGVMPAYGLSCAACAGLELANMRFSYDAEDLRPWWLNFMDD